MNTAEPARVTPPQREAALKELHSRIGRGDIRMVDFEWRRNLIAAAGTADELADAVDPAAQHRTWETLPREEPGIDFSAALSERRREPKPEESRVEQVMSYQERMEAQHAAAAAARDRRDTERDDSAWDGLGDVFEALFGDPYRFDADGNERPWWMGR